MTSNFKIGRNLIMRGQIFLKVWFVRFSKKYIRSL
nr:MAG TPA: hypothetical protein [Caudoviricetes sp.]